MAETRDGVEIVAGLRVRVLTVGHECISNVADPPLEAHGHVRVCMHRGVKLFSGSELTTKLDPQPTQRAVVFHFDSRSYDTLEELKRRGFKFDSIVVRNPKTGESRMLSIPIIGPESR